VHTVSQESLRNQKTQKSLAEQEDIVFQKTCELSRKESQATTSSQVHSSVAAATAAVETAPVTSASSQASSMASRPVLSEQPDAKKAAEPRRNLEALPIFHWFDHPGDQGKKDDSKGSA
jgi:hypothetical protein